MSMPRQAKLDTPGALHHVMGRGIEGCPVFRPILIGRISYEEELGLQYCIAQSDPRLLPSFLEGPLVLVELTPGSGVRHK